MVNQWVEHVRKYAKDNNISYMCAIEKAKASYNPSKKEKPPGKRELGEKKEKDYIKQIEGKEEYQGLYNDLMKKIDTREKSRQRRESKKIDDQLLKSEFGVSDDFLTKMSIQQLRDRIKYISDNKDKFEYPDLIHLEIQPYLFQLNKKLKQEEQQKKQKEKKKKDKQKKENEKVEKELKNISF
jgi:hypothetical protein